METAYETDVPPSPSPPPPAPIKARVTKKVSTAASSAKRKLTMEEEELERPGAFQKLSEFVNSYQHDFEMSKPKAKRQKKLQLKRRKPPRRSSFLEST